MEMNYLLSLPKVWQNCGSICYITTQQRIMFFLFLQCSTCLTDYFLSGCTGWRKKNGATLSQHIILQQFTNFYAIRSWNFQNICNEIGWPIGPVFCATLYLFYTTLCAINWDWMKQYFLCRFWSKWLWIAWSTDWLIDWSIDWFIDWFHFNAFQLTICHLTLLRPRKLFSGDLEHTVCICHLLLIILSN